MSQKWIIKLLRDLKAVAAYKRLNDSTEVERDIKNHHAEFREETHVY